jgi:precorrin-3B C17-methyltransferase
MADSNPEGSLTLVGIGPGGLDYLTRRAERAIREADVVVGYRLYLQLIIPLIEDKNFLEFPMGAELERAQESVKRALDGERVSLVTGGDPGIYGMAAPVYQALQDLSEDEAASVNLEVIPGVIAATASASLIGTPMIQDFAVISLSDRFVPWA